MNDYKKKINSDAIKNINKESKNNKKDTENKEDNFFGIIWEGKPSGLFQSFLTKLHLNFTTYQITNDELIITTGFFVKKQKSCELYCLKDPDLTQNLYQQWLNIGTITVRVDATQNSEKRGTVLTLKNIKNADRIRKVLRDAIEDDVMERKITYFDKIG